MPEGAAVDPNPPAKPKPGAAPDDAAQPVHRPQPTSPPPGYAPQPRYVPPAGTMAPPASALVAAYPPRPGTSYPPYPGTPYPQGTPAAFRPPPANRAWPAQSAAGRLRMAAMLGIAAFGLAALLRVVEATTGVSDIPGSHAFSAGRVEMASTLVRGAELVLVAFALVAGAAALPQLRESGRLLGEPAGDTLRRGSTLLAGAGAITTLGSVGAWIYFSTTQQSLPGMGVGTDPGLNRLFEQYRLALVASAAAGAVGAFVFVGGLERILGRLLTGDGRRDFTRFARVFTLAAAANAALVILLFFAVHAPTTLAGPPAQAWFQGLLVLGPAMAATSLVSLYRVLGRVGARAKEISKRSPARKE